MRIPASIKLTVLNISAILLHLPAFAQADAQFSQRLFNRISYNPAATGASPYLTIALDVREQWVDGPVRPARNSWRHITILITSGRALD